MNEMGDPWDKETKDDKQSFIWLDVSKSKIHKDDGIPEVLDEDKPKTT